MRDALLVGSADRQYHAPVRPVDPGPETAAEPLLDGALLVARERAQVRVVRDHDTVVGRECVASLPIRMLDEHGHEVPGYAVIGERDATKLVRERIEAAKERVRSLAARRSASVALAYPIRVVPLMTETGITFW